jgi:CRISPR/Cas system CMR-associated protein Cmr1 (group 7 of RAMP superfamily)
MASPVILKPLAVSEERAVPLVLVLNAPHIWDDGAPGVVLKQGGRQQPISREMLQIGENSRHVHPLHNDRYKVTNARDAVLALAADRWNTRAERL